MRSLLIGFLLAIVLHPLIHATSGPQPSFDQLPFRFRENKGQWNEGIRYGAWSGSANVYFLDQGLSITHWNGNDEKKNFLTWNIRFLHANPGTPTASISGQCQTHYISGYRNITIDKEYALLHYKEVYPHIDLQYYGFDNTLKYDFILRPGADVRDIQLKAEGIDHYEIVDGALIAHHAWGTVKEARPYSYQIINGKQQEVDVRFKLYDRHTYGFEIKGPYNPEIPLTIDPIKLLWGSYVGSDNPNSQGYMYDIAVDKERCVYGTGYYQASFPTTPGAFQTTYKGGDINGSNGDAFVFKMTEDGKSLLFSTYIGGIRDEEGRAIFVTKNGRVYLAGTTNSTDFPISGTAYQKSRKGLKDAFVTCLDAYQGTLIASTYIGGLDDDRINDIKVDEYNKVWVGGETRSIDYPVKNPTIRSSYQGGTFDGFISKLTSNLQTLEYSSLVGGAGDDKVNALAYFNNTITFVGYSGSSDFGVTPGAYQSQNKGGIDVIAGRIATATNQLQYATFIGGTYDDAANDIDCNPLGACFITGYTMSADYPNTAGIPLKGLKDVFVTSLASDGNSLVYSRLVGGKRDEQGTSIIVNVQNQTFIVGNTVSQDFPLNEPNAKDQGIQVFLISLDYTGNFLSYSKMIGGSKDDSEIPRLAFSNKEVLCEVVVGFSSHSLDLNTTAGSFQPSKLNGGERNSQPALLKYYFGPALPFCTIPDYNYGYKTPPQTIRCDTIKKTVCPGLIPIELPIRPDNDTAYFNPWVYLLDNQLFTPPLNVNYTGGQYFDSVKVSDGCSNMVIPVKIDQPPVSLTLLVPNTYLCSNDPNTSVTLTASVIGYENILWSTGDTTSSITVDSPGIYKVNVSNGPCGEKDSATVEIKMGNPPGNPFSGNQQVSYCFPGNYTLNALTATDNIPLTGYTWVPGGQTTQSITITQGGTYCITKSNVCGTVNSCIKVNELRAPEINLGKDTVLCQGQTIVLSVPDLYKDLGILWSTGATMPSIVAQPGQTYWVKVTNVCGTGYDEIIIGVSPDQPLANLGPDLVKCSPSDFPLTLHPGFTNATFLWSTGETTATIQVMQGGTYWVKLFNGCGTDEDTINILSNPVNNLTLGPDLRGCTPVAYVLDPGNYGAGSTYSWSTGATGQSITVSQTGTYTVTVNNSCGTSSASVQVKVDQGLPAFSLGADFFICPGTSQTLNGPSGALSYLWDDGSTSSVRTVNGPGTYWLQVTNSCGSYRDSIKVTTQPALFTGLPTDTNLCDPAIVLLSVPQQNCTYLWNTGSTGRSIVVSTAGTYTVTLTNTCEQISASVQVTYSSSAPTVDLGPDLIRCGNTPFRDTLQAGPASHYLWNNGKQTDTLIVSTPGLYSVTASNACGIDTDTLLVIGDPVKTGLTDISFCNTTPVTLDAGNAGATYLWTPGNQTTQSISVVQTGQYIVEISNVCGTLKDTIVVSLETHPPVFDLGPDLRLCSPLTQTLNPGITGATYLWTTGSTSPSITVSDAGVYGVTVTNACGSTKDSLHLIIDFGIPNVHLGNDTIVCNPVVVALDAGPDGATYSWTPGGQTSQQLVAFAQGTYEVLVTNACGSASDNITITGYGQPNIQLKDTATCNTPVTFDVTSLPASYYWRPVNVTTPTLTVTQSGTYSVEISGHPCGIFTALTHVIINTDVPQIDLGADTALCTPAGFILDAGTYEGGTTKWLPSGNTDQYLPVTQPGSYILEATNYCGTNRDTVDIGANPIQFPDVPETTVCAYSSTVLHTPVIAGYTYLWYPAKDAHDTLSTADTALVYPSYPYTNYVTKAGDGPCYNLDTVRVNVYAEVDPKIAAEDFEGYIPLGLHFKDIHHSGTVYSWTFDDGGTSTDAAPYHVFHDERYYTVTVHAENNAGCYGDDTLQVRAFDLFIPNLVTVNGDNMNDTWDLTNLNPYLHVEIYNRWGEKVYEKDNYVDEWHGQDVQNGIYYFYVRDTKYAKEFKGWIHLVK